MRNLIQLVFMVTTKVLETNEKNFFLTQEDLNLKLD